MIEPTNDLSGPTVAFLTAYVKETMSAPREELSEETLVDFAMGALPRERRQHVAEELLYRDDLSRRLSEIYAELSHLESTSVSAASPAIRTVVNRWLNAYLTAIQTPSSRSGFEFSVWRNLASAIGANVRPVLGQWRAAAYRSGAITPLVSPGEVGRVSLFADVDDYGRLTAMAEFEEDADWGLSRYSGESCRLELIDPAGGSLPLGEGVIDGATCQFSVEGFGSATEIDGGALPAERFRIVVGQGATEATHHRRFSLDFPGSQRLEGEFLEPPEVRDGQLTFTFRLDRVPEAFDLGVSVPVATSRILLGRCRLDESVRDGQQITIPMPEVTEGVFYCGSVLRLSLLPVEER